MRSIVARESRPTTLHAALRQLGTLTINVSDDLDVPCRIVPALNGIVVNPALFDGDLDGTLLQYIDAAAKQLAPRPKLTVMTGDAEPGEPTERPALRLVRG